ncbi:MAG: hypothetical protein AAF711_20280 [Planctomycetota bacterium]
MVKHLAKLIELIWYVAMGLFLGMSAGTILAVVETFDSSRKVDARPGQPPFANELFSESSNEIVAGYIAQNLFLVGGVVSLCLLGLAVLSRVLCPIAARLATSNHIGSALLSGIRLGLLAVCVVLMLVGGNRLWEMRQSYPMLYEAEAGQAVLEERRSAFETSYDLSRHAVRGAWFTGLITLLISPWCRRLTDGALQSVDGQEVKQEENHAEEGGTQEVRAKAR